MRCPTRTRSALEEFFRTGIDDCPELGAVPHLLHVGGEPAVAADPVLHGLRIIRHQIGGAGVARDLDAAGRGFVVIGHVESEARPRRHANPVERNDAEHQGAGRVADAVDDDAIAAYLALYSSTTPPWSRVMR